MQNKIEALDGERDERQALRARGGLDGHSRIGMPVVDCRREVRLGERRSRQPVERVVVDLRPIKQLQEQVLASCLRLSWRDARGPFHEIGESLDPQRVAGSKQQTLDSLRPFDDHEIRRAHALAHQRHVVVARRRVEPVHRRNGGFAARKALESRAASTSQDGESAT